MDTVLIESGMERMLDASLPTLYVMIGVSGSGKSTYTSKLGCNTKLAVVSTDEIREQMFGDATNQQKGAQVFAEAYARINDELRRGKDVVFDATNTTHKGRRQLIRAVRVPCRKVAVMVIPHLSTSMAQNICRERVVPLDVIERQHDQLLKDGEKIPEMFDDLTFVKET